MISVAALYAYDTFKLHFLQLAVGKPQDIQFAFLEHSYNQ